MESTTLTIAHPSKRPATMEQGPPKKKRVRTSTSPDSDDRKRGRPRVDKQDESAADRRRTQIRMAQRAYRQRKESTLDELRKRVSDLTQTIETMNRAFITCADRLYASNVDQDQMMDINEVSTVFEKLVAEARNPGEESVLDSDEQQKPSNMGPPLDLPHELSERPKNVPSWLDESAVVMANKPKASFPHEVGMGYTMIMPDDDTLQAADLMEISAMNQEMQDKLPLSGLQHQEEIHLFPAGTDTIQIPNSPSPPLTYSFQETTFARRLHRACAEAAYQLLLDPRRRPAEYERIFRLSLLGRDRSKITAALRAVIDRGPHEDLDFWEAPHIHVGGAGTHYPRRDPFGNLLPKKLSYNVGRVGPQTLSMLENAAKANLSTNMTVELAGFEGEWFDPYDVQGYLEEKGIFIDPTSSFAEAQIVEWPRSRDDASTISSGGNVATPPGPFTPTQKSTPLTTSQVNALINDVDVDFSKWDDSANLELTNVGYSDAEFGSWANFLQPGEAIRQYNAEQAAWEEFNIDPTNGMSMPSSHPASPQPRRKSVIIDVTKLVKVLVLSGVCLGRTPGFRRKDVDRAIAITSFDAF